MSKREEDPELRAMRRMAMAMAELDPDVEQAGRVCDWFESRYRPDAPGLEVGDMTWTETR